MGLFFGTEKVTFKKMNILTFSRLVGDPYIFNQPTLTLFSGFRFSGNMTKFTTNFEFLEIQNVRFVEKSGHIISFRYMIYINNMIL